MVLAQKTHSCSLILWINENSWGSTKLQHTSTIWKICQDPPRTLLSWCPVWKPRLVVWGSPARTPLGGGSWLGWLGWCFKGQCGYGKIWIAGAFRCTRTPRTPWTLDRPTMGVGQTMGVGILVKGRKLIRVLFFQVNLMSRFRSQGT